MFMTSVDLADLSPGDAGICVSVLSTAISMKRIVEFNHGSYYEERERMSARIKIKFCCNSLVKTVIQDTMFSPVLVEVVKCCSYHAG